MANMKETQKCLNITMPIYRKDYVLGARKDNLLGLNWYTQASNTFKKKGKTSTGVAQVKKLIHALIVDNRERILNECPGWDPIHTDSGFHVTYKVYAKRLGTDGHNIRSAMEKMILDGCEEAGLIDNDKYVYSTESRFYLDRSNPRIEVTIEHNDDYEYVVN